MSTRRVVFIGFDAGNTDLILQWAEAGLLPTFRSLLARGLRGDTMSLPGWFTGSTWPSFATGVTPARHGFYSWKQLKPGTYEFFICHTGDQLRRKPFWDTLSRAGRRVCVMDIPLSSRSTHLNGIQLVEWGSHDAQYGFMTWPPGLAQEVEARFGRHPQRGACNADRGPAEFLKLRDDLLHGIATKAEVTRYFLKRGPWDFFAQVFTESHCVGHQCWHIHDAHHPRHDRETARIVGDPVRDVYIAIDAAIGKVLGEVDRDAHVIVLVSHGMGYKYGPQFLFDKILLRLGVAQPPGPAQQTPDSVRRREQLDAVLTWCWQRVPAAGRQVMQPVRHRLRHWIDRDAPPPPPHIDPATSKCFPVENNYAHGAIRVNLVGREPHGQIRPGAEFDTFCEQLTCDLMEIRDLDTGQPVVSRVIRTAECYPGEYADHLPDLLVEWAADRPVYRMRLGSAQIGEIEGTYNFCRTGDHRPGGMFIALGPSVPQGRLDRTVSILDFAPTMTSLLGVPLPDVDGKPMMELLL